MISSLHTLLFVKLANVQLQLVIYGDFRLFSIFALIRCETMTDRKKGTSGFQTHNTCSCSDIADTCRLRSSKVAKYVQLTVTDKCI